MIKGISCRACVALIKFRVESLDGIKNVSINEKTGLMKILSDQLIAIADLKKALTGLPYTIIE